MSDPTASAITLRCETKECKSLLSIDLTGLTPDEQIAALVAANKKLRSILSKVELIDGTLVCTVIVKSARRRTPAMNATRAVILRDIRMAVNHIREDSTQVATEDLSSSRTMRGKKGNGPEQTIRRHDSHKGRRKVVAAT